ncbi:MAG: tyrosine-type recombinase/integrase [Candidatus Bathyarchaeota archaeon]|nr:tyrosine-type recombinase/integrase [Candidatus Bathyarchaeota archaeon]
MAGLTPEDSIFGNKASSNTRKSDNPESAGASPLCPKCRSDKVWRDSKRYTKLGNEIQRWYCRDCGRRISDPTDVAKARSTLEHIERIESKSLKTADDIVTSRQICVTETKNLVAEPQRNRFLRRNETIQLQANANIPEKVVNYLLWLKKQGYAESTIFDRVKIIKFLAKNANIDDPESIKELIAKRDSWGLGRKEIVVECYSNYLICVGGTWNPPRYKAVEKLPFIPTESEIDYLIACLGNKTGTFAQLLKETGARRGEAWQLEWTDIDAENRTVRITPEKHSNPRLLKISQRLLERLQDLPKNNIYVFGGTNLETTARLFELSRKIAANKSKNPRLLKITFHTLRHWKATMEYHKTKDILHVMKTLGHKNIKNTLRYTQLVDFGDQDYVVKVAWTLEESVKLLEAGFQYVCDYEKGKIFRKPK